MNIKHLTWFSVVFVLGCLASGYFAYQYGRQNVVTARASSAIVGVRHGETIEVETRYWTIIDTDNFGRLVGIEILAPGDLKDGLRKYADA